MCDFAVMREKSIRDIKKKETLCWGRHLNQAPDLTIIFNPGWQATRHPEITKRNPFKRYVNDNPKWSGGHDGTHDPIDVPGIIAIKGPDIQECREITVHLWDIAPTILNLFKIPIPKDMDGQPIPF